MGFGINFSMTAVVAMAVVGRKAVGGAAAQRRLPAWRPPGALLLARRNPTCADDMSACQALAGLSTL